MIGHPCVNPHCKSHGQPHPNCRCYEGSFAEGGSVDGYCSKSQVHKAECEYFADGGVASADFIPDSQFVPDQSLVTTPDFIPDKEFKPDTTASTAAPDFIPDGKFVPDINKNEKYGSASQQAITALEGTAQGLAGPFATLAETKLLGVNPEDIVGRKETNPWTHGISEAAGLGAGLLTGAGEAGLIAKGASHLVPEATTILGKIGSGVIKGAIESGALQGSDEISRAMLGQGDPEAPVSSALAHIGAASLMGGVAGGIFGSSSQAINKLQEIADQKLSVKAEGYLTGIGMASKMRELGIPLEETESFVSQHLKDSNIPFKEIKSGIDLYESALSSFQSKGVKAVGDLAGGVVGHSIGGWPGAIAGYQISDKLLLPMAEKLLNKTIGKANPYVFHAITHALSKGQTNGIPKILDYARKVAKGSKAINSGLESVFKAGGQQSVEGYATEADKEKLKKFIEEGGLNAQIQNQLNSRTQMFAEGGGVDPQPMDQPDALATAYPEQGMLLGAAKGRINDYLNSIRPAAEQAKLTFDDEVLDREKERGYDRALGFAVKPLSILNNIKDGSLTPDDVKHFTSLYPELYQHLNKEIASRISTSQMNGEKPSYKTRQGLSLFLGTPLDSSFTPSSIQAAQNVFASKKMQPGTQQTGKPKKNTATLTKAADSHYTQDQARSQRQSQA